MARFGVVFSPSAHFYSARTTFRARAIRFLIAAGLAISYFAPVALAQNEGLGNTTSTPVPGVPHDYIVGLNEIVNPANGALSIRVPQPYPHERNPNWPRYAFSYDSNLQFSKKTGWTQIPNSNVQNLSSLSYQTQSNALSDSGQLEACLGNNCQQHLVCQYKNNFIQVDPAGGRHALGIQATKSNNPNACPYFGIPGPDQPQGGDERYKASMANYDSALQVWDLHGNTPTQAGTLQEDVNGNYLDTTGRTPLPLPYTTEPISVTATKQYNMSPIPGYNCAVPNNKIIGGGSFTAIKSVDLPNGQKYLFEYDPAYGLLKKITYPTGATVEYTWNTILNAEGVHYSAVNNSQDLSGTCDLRHDWFAIVTRVVKLDGVTPAQEQDFSYQTNWGASPTFQWLSKTTTVTTKDRLRGTQFTTVYNYLPKLPPQTSNPWWVNLGNMPVEDTITYNDTSNNLLKTVTKVWNSINQMTAECETLPNGQTAGKFYAYQAYSPQNWNSYPIGYTTDLPTDVAEYDYGAVSTPCVQPSGAPTRETITTYQTFGPTPLVSVWPSLLDRPATVKVYGNGARESETDYAYDGVVPDNVTPPPVGHDETNYGGGLPAPRGNPTTITRKCFVGAQACTDSVTHYSYDTTGQLLSTTDAKGNVTQYSYTDSYSADDGSPTGNTNAFVTKITEPPTNGVSHITQFKYGFDDGKLRSATDENGQVTTFCYWTGGCSGSAFDSFVRLTGISYPDVGLSTFTYTDSSSPSVTATKAITSILDMVTTTTYDALGRPVGTTLSTDPDGPTNTVTTYDGMGQQWKVYNPTRCASPTLNCGETTWGFATYVYDAFGRVCLMAPTDVSPPAPTTICPTTAPVGSVSTIYSSNQATVTDEAGNQRKSQTDALGRLRYVWEAPNNANYNYQTTYTYDARSNLLSTSQTGGSRTRTFAYDSLSRLLTGANPESGTINYSYDPNGNVSSKIAPLPNASTGTVTTNYQYDALNRLTAKTYTGMTMPNLRFGYDGTALTGCTTAPPSIPNPPPYLVGHRTAMCDGAGATSWDYDPMGRVLATARTTLGNPNPTTTARYSYYLDGSLLTLRNPSNQTVLNYTVKGAGRPTDVTDSTFGVNYVTHASYAPQGALSVYTNGSVSGGFAGIVTSNSYNNRLQPAVLSAANPTQTIFSLSYGFNAGSNNGNVRQVANGVRNDATANVAFNYDPLNRISQANTTTTGTNCWGEVYTIDAWGNLTNISGVSTMTNCLTENQNVPVSSNNRITGWCYDGAGNLLDMGSCAPAVHSFVYDAEGQLQSPPVANGIGALPWTYFYDGDGNRVQKCGANPCTGSQAGTLYWRGATGEVLAESGRTGNMLEEYIYFGGQRIARRDAGTGNVHYYFSDHLGSASVIADSNGNVQQQMDFYPYGGIGYTSGVDPNHYKFTGKERDTESGVDYFGARYYGSILGRFMTPDWAVKPTAVPYANFGNPQSLNLYSYVQNNPTTLGDPDGHYFFGSGGINIGCFYNWGGPCEQPVQCMLCNSKPAVQAQNKKSWWASLTGALAVGVARISPAAARKMWEAANPGLKVPLDAARGRFQDMAHIKALADGGTNAAGNLKPQEHGEHMAEHMANGDFARWASRAKDAVVNGAEAAGREIESDARTSANEIVHDVREAATEVMQNPGEAVRDAATAVVEAEESGELPPP